MSESTPNAPVPQVPGRQGTTLGLALGLVLSMLLAAALVIPAAKAGITPGVSPLVVLLGWVLFGGLAGTGLKRFLAISQVTGSAGAAVTAGVVFTAPILQIVARNQGVDVPPVDVPVLILAGLAGSFLGFGFVGLGTKRFLTDPRLPAPEAVACDRLIETAVSNPDERPRLLTSLMPGLLGGALVQAGLFFKYLHEQVGQLALPAPWAPAAWMTDEDGKPLGAHARIDLPVETAPLYLGIGALLTLPTAILVFAGGLVNAATQSWSGSQLAVAPTPDNPDTTFRWVGGAAMTVAVLYSLAMYVLEGRKSGSNASPSDASIDETLLEQSPFVRRGLYLSIGVGMLLLVVMMVMVGAPLIDLVVIGAVALVLVSLLSGLGGLLSLQVGSSASPVSGTVFMGMLVLSLTALGLGLQGEAGIAFIVPIVVAACVAICAANDSSQDYKTLQLNGFTVSDGFLGQLLGLIGGAIVVPLTLWVAHESNLRMGGLGLGDPDALPAPQAGFFGTVLSSLFLEGARPTGPILFGSALGVLAVIVDHMGKKRGVILSSLAFAVGIYLPSHIGTGMMLGALARFVATRNVAKTTHEGILMAAGLITGQALMELLGGILILVLAKQTVEGMFASEDGMLPQWVVVVSFVAFLVFIAMNYAAKRRVAES